MLCYTEKNNLNDTRVSNAFQRSLICFKLRLNRIRKREISFAVGNIQDHDSGFRAFYRKLCQCPDLAHTQKRGMDFYAFALSRLRKAADLSGHGAGAFLVVFAGQMPILFCQNLRALPGRGAAQRLSLAGLRICFRADLVSSGFAGRFDSSFDSVYHRLGY